MYGQCFKGWWGYATPEDLFSAFYLFCYHYLSSAIFFRFDQDLISHCQREMQKTPQVSQHTHIWLKAVSSLSCLSGSYNRSLLKQKTIVYLCKSRCTALTLGYVCLKLLYRVKYCGHSTVTLAQYWHKRRRWLFWQEESDVEILTRKCWNSPVNNTGAVILQCSCWFVSVSRICLFNHKQLPQCWIWEHKSMVQNNSLS